MNIKKAFKKNTQIIPWALFCCACLVIIYLLFCIKWQSKDSIPVGSDTEVQNIIAEVGGLIVLPQNETPTVATVTDLSALKDQAFFANAKVGDKVLIYSISKKAILYDPSANKIINVAPLDTGASTSANSAQ